MSRLARAALVGLALASLALPVGTRAQDVDKGCESLRANRWAAATGAQDTAGDVRVHAIQFKQDVRFVVDYETFRAKMECLLLEFVVPNMDPAHPDIVVMNEDLGLATIATGTRGAAARLNAAHGPKDPANIPGALSAFASIGVAHAPAVAYYAAAAPDTSPQRLILAAATDTFVRGFMTTMSDLAREFGVYLVASNNQAEFRESSDPATIAALADPDLIQQYADGTLSSVYEAVDVPGEAGSGRAGIDVFNRAWMWAPANTTTSYAAARYGALSPSDPRRNIIAEVKKTPITPIERSVLDLSDDGDMTAANTGPFMLSVADDPAQRIKIGYGISLPGFKWGSDFGKPFTGDACASPNTWMRCLDARGMNLFLQPEANPGRWADYIDSSWTPTAYQSLSWLNSAWRSVADPTVKNIRYAVTPHLVGNLIDLTFDGQSVIFERCLPRSSGDTCDGNAATNFVGAKVAQPCGGSIVNRCDGPLLAPYAGYHRHFMATAPWVSNDCPMCLGPIADRERLSAISRSLEAGTGSPMENDYLETAIWADLDFDPAW